MTRTRRNTLFALPRDWTPSFPGSTDPDARRCFRRDHTDGILETAVVSPEGSTVEVSAYLPHEDRAFFTATFRMADLVAAFAAPHAAYALAGEIVERHFAKEDLTMTTPARSITMTDDCEHANTTCGPDRCFSGPVSLDPNPSAHGGITYEETCSDCGARRGVNVNQFFYEYGEWYMVEEIAATDVHHHQGRNTK